MNRQTLSLVTLIAFGLSPPAQAEEPYYESEVLQEVPLPDGGLLKQTLTTEIIPGTDAPPYLPSEDVEVVVVPDPAWGEICIFPDAYGTYFYAYDYNSPYGNYRGDYCEVMRSGYWFVGTIALTADL